MRFADHRPPPARVETNWTRTKTGRSDAADDRTRGDAQAAPRNAFTVITCRLWM
ncbi:hypothetical protein LA76x_2592 [Lysobacter antibioticus]|uniref:Uncharacterized protein n=1 Tax=Lysobacter antibioticus TaxID=84531 RepID=A0A0S2FAW5_LYSAN|nr:hypothetical protein LA76x_2592 [Lysobacter antibioticus]